MRFVLDTNTVSYFFRNEGAVAEHLLSYPPRDIALPTIVLYEVRYGLRRARAAAVRLRQFEAFAGTIQVLAFGIPEAEAAATIRTELEDSGSPIGPYDVLIAATAIAHDATLVTHNTREFSRVTGLRLADWY